MSKVIKKTKVEAPPKALATTTAAPLPAHAAGIADEWGITSLTSRDIMIPKILAMQAMSQPVISGEAKFGELRDSLNGKILGGIAKPITFIPFYMDKCFVVMRVKDGKFKFHRTEAITAYTEDHEFECTAEDGQAEKWYRTMNYYVLLENELKNKEAIPYVISFRSTSARAGQKLATTMFMKNIKAGKTPAAMIMELSATKTQNDKGTYVVLDVKESRPSTEAEVSEAFQWVKTVRAGKVKADHSDLEQETSSGTVGTAPESTEY